MQAVNFSRIAADQKCTYDDRARVLKVVGLPEAAACAQRCNAARHCYYFSFHEQVT